MNSLSQPLCLGMASLSFSAERPQVIIQLSNPSNQAPVFSAWYAFFARARQGDTFFMVVLTKIATGTACYRLRIELSCHAQLNSNTLTQICCSCQRLPSLRVTPTPQTHLNKETGTEYGNCALLWWHPCCVRLDMDFSKKRWTLLVYTGKGLQRSVKTQWYYEVRSYGRSTAGTCWFFVICDKWKLVNLQLIRKTWKAPTSMGQRKKSESPTGFEPTTFQDTDRAF